jgi:hypothetical protein
VWSQICNLGFAMSKLRSLFFVLMSLVGPLACTATATPVVAVDPFERSISWLEDPKDRQRVANVVATPEIQRAMGEMSSAIVKGVAAGLTSEQMVADIERMSRRLTESLTASLARRMETDIVPATAAIASAAVEAATRAAIRTASAELPDQLAPAMRKALVDELGPAVEAVLRNNVGPGLTNLAGAPEFHAALGTTGRALAREVIYGTNEAMAELEERDAQRGLLARTARFFANAGWVVWVLVGIGAIAATAFAVRRWRSRSVARSTEHEREMRETVLLTVAETLRAAEGQPWAGDLRRVLREKIDGEAEIGLRSRVAHSNGARPEH